MVLFAACRGGSAPASVAPPATSTPMSLTGDAAAASAAYARTFVAMLPDSTRSVALRAFDNADRTRWFFIPTELIPNGRMGLVVSRMAPRERDVAFLRQLLTVYSNRMSPASARAQWQRIEEAGFGNLHFVWAGSSVIGKAHYYRIHGPTVLVEYDNSQNNANHSHTVWRDLEHDFGGDILRAHYEKHQHSAR
jgi:hypothetical protein